VTLAEAARQYRDAVEHRRAVLDVMVEVDREELDAAVRAAEDVLQVAWLEANCSRR
jgi:hypothetical protein